MLSFAITIAPVIVFRPKLCTSMRGGDGSDDFVVSPFSAGRQAATYQVDAPTGGERVQRKQLICVQRRIGSRSKYGGRLPMGFASR